MPARGSRFLSLVAALAAGVVLFTAGMPSGGAATPEPGWPSQDPATPRPPGAPQAPVLLPPDETCLDCHEDLISRAVVHPPAEEEMCIACHMQADDERHEFEIPEELAVVCKNCHEIEEQAVMHKPVAAGKCTACHDPHSTEGPSLLKGASEDRFCLRCHADKEGRGQAHVHGPVAAGACTACHQPHGSEEEKLLSEPSPDLCLGCHLEMEERLDGAEVVHVPVEGDCTLCHDPHASPNEFQLLAAGRQLCLRCHTSIGERMQLAVHHDALVQDKECLNCHRPHHSALPAMMDHPSAELCLRCHNQPLERPDGTPILNMAAKLAGEPRHHGPIREDNCSACHDPHGSETFSILRKAYPRKFYSPWNPDLYQLCLSCHDEQAFTTEATDNLTGFRNGTKNLHFVHVHRDVKGRTCRACHDTHASLLPKHITASVPFGAWEIPISFEKLPDGGSCSPGCHVPRSYSRTQAVIPVPEDPGKIPFPSAARAAGAAGAEQ